MWNGNRLAQQMADDAWNAVPKRKKNRTAKQRRKLPKQPPARVNYFAYLKSTAWQNRRRSAFKYHGKRCSVCGSEKSLQVHHKHYNTLGREKMKDLQILCSACHANEHEGKVCGVADPMTTEFLNLMR